MKCLSTKYKTIRNIENIVLENFLAKCFLNQQKEIAEVTKNIKKINQIYNRMIKRKT